MKKSMKKQKKFLESQILYLKKMEDLFEEFLKTIGEDPNREGLIKTPKRASRAFKFLTRGYDQDIDDIINGAYFEAESQEMIVVKNIELYSLCEHHILPFIGKAHVGYIPDKKIVGLSKIARIVDMYARRLQIQERLSRQIADTLMNKIEAQGVGVVIEAEHLCMMMRGVEKQNSCMITSAMRGAFRRDAKARSEFLSLINHP